MVLDELTHPSPHAGIRLPAALVTGLFRIVFCFIWDSRCFFPAFFLPGLDEESQDLPGRDSPFVPLVIWQKLVHFDYSVVRARIPLKII